jgi:hypothetical protein
MSRQQIRWLILPGILVLMAVIQVTIAKRQCLWADEIFSLAIATGHSLEHPAVSARPELGDFVESDQALAPEELRRYTAHDHPAAGVARVIRAVSLSDTSPPLYYLLLHGWTRILGTSDLVLRLFSIIWSLASLPLIAALARRIGGERTVFPACVLFAFSPLTIYYSTEGRMYSLLIFLTLATVVLSLLLQERGPRIHYGGLWIALSAAGFLTHYFFVFPWLACAVFLFFQPGKFQRRWLLLCSLGAGLLILPWIWVAAGTFTSWKVTQGWLSWKPAGFHRARAVFEQFTQFFLLEGHGLWRTPWWSKLSALILFGIAAGIAGWRLRQQIFSGPRLLLWLWLIAGCAGPTAIDLVQHTYTANVPRYAIAALPAAYLLAAFGVTCLEQPIRLLTLVCIVALWLSPITTIYRQRARNLEPFRDAARIAGTGSNASDLILVHSIPSGVLGIARYSNGPAPIASWVGQLGTRRVPASLASLVAGRNRISLVKLHEVGQPAPEEDWLRNNGQVLQEKRIGAATIVQFKCEKVTTFD